MFFYSRNDSSLTADSLLQRGIHSGDVPLGSNVNRCLIITGDSLRVAEIVVLLEHSSHNGSLIWEEHC